MKNVGIHFYSGGSWVKIAAIAGEGTHWAAECAVLNGLSDHEFDHGQYIYFNRRVHSGGAQAARLLRRAA